MMPLSEILLSHSFGEEDFSALALWERAVCASKPGEGGQKPLIPQPLLPKEKGSNIGGSDKSAKNIQKSFSLWEKVACRKQAG